jgi:hypothetical protein
MKKMGFSDYDPEEMRTFLRSRRPEMEKEIVKKLDESIMSKSMSRRMRAQQGLPQEESDFEKELCELINKYSKENLSNTPDYILASYLIRCLDAFNYTMVLKNSHSKR